MEMTLEVLDVTCGGRMMWDQKDYPHAVYLDKRIREPGFMGVRPGFSVEPDIQADYTKLPFSDRSFALIVFDPPHMVRKTEDENSFLVMKYGTLKKDTWEDSVREGFKECWRVLKPSGTLIVKWSETSISGSAFKKLLFKQPLFETRVGTKGTTFWYCFFKPA